MFSFNPKMDQDAAFDRLVQDLRHEADPAALALGHDLKPLETDPTWNRRASRHCEKGYSSNVGFCMNEKKGVEPLFISGKQGKRAVDEDEFSDEEGGFFYNSKRRKRTLETARNARRKGKNLLDTFLEKQKQKEREEDEAARWEKRRKEMKMDPTVRQKAEKARKKLENSTTQLLQKVGARKECRARDHVSRAQQALRKKMNFSLQMKSDPNGNEIAGDLMGKRDALAEVSIVDVDCSTDSGALMSFRGVKSGDTFKFLERKLDIDEFVELRRSIDAQKPSKSFYITNEQVSDQIFSSL